MFSPETQQIEICMLKSSLEEIENDLVAHCTALPALDAENEQYYNETMTALKIARYVNAEIERLKQDNVVLTAKRMQLKRQCMEVGVALQQARAFRLQIAEELHQEERDEELEIRRYEDSLREKADRLRQTRVFYNENEMNSEIEKLNKIASDLEMEVRRRVQVVDELQGQLDELTPSVPENLLDLLGKQNVDNNLNFLMEKSNELKEQRDNLLKNNGENY